jgi:hypothetical protein
MYSLANDKETYVDAVCIFVPPPPHRVFNAEFDCHAFLTNGRLLLQVLVFLFRSHVCLRMERLRIHFNKVWHTDNPMLQWSVEHKGRAMCKNGLTSPSELLGKGMFGTLIPASSICSNTGAGASSSSYSIACLCIRSGEESRSFTPAGELGDSALYKRW